MAIKKKKKVAKVVSTSLFGKAERTVPKAVPKQESGITYEMLSDEQKSAIGIMMKFVESDDRQMVMTGSAGVGKSVLTKMFLDRLDSNGYKYVCTAPTNEAVRVVSKSCGRKYDSTIYSLLGLSLVQDDDGPAVIRPMGESKLGEYDIVIVDECSMINSELFARIQDCLDEYSHVKIIYIGDKAQLPPVNDPNGESPTFAIESCGASLTQVQRCAADNPIIAMVTEIRNNLESDKDVFEKESKYNTELGVGIEFEPDREKFMSNMYSLFKSTDFNADVNHVRALAYTNAAVDAMNAHIRRELFGEHAKDYVVDEVLMMGEPLMNDRQVVFSVGERVRVDSVTLKTDSEYGFKYWSLTIQNFEAPSYQRRMERVDIIHRNYVGKYREVLAKKATTAKEMVKITADRKRAWLPYFAFKNRFAWVKYIYAITVHRSQGSTFKNVFVVNADLDRLRWNNVERNKLKYVAFTRASHRLCIY